MPAGAYTGWLHWRFVGDQEAAKRYIPQGRKVLGFVHQQCQSSGNASGKYTQRLDDGTEITAEFYGSQPRCTIYVPPADSVRRPPTIPEDFVVWARNDEFPNGLDDAYPQQILRPEWKTFFFNSGIAGYDEFSRSKGTYQLGDNGEVLFPDGIRHAGNVDWRGKGGQRINWYGPSTRYWVDPFVQPVVQYGRHVFMLGQVLLDIDQYIIDSDPDEPFEDVHVMGAALDGLDLYTMQAKLPIGETSVSPVPPETYTTDEYYPVNPIRHVLSRYRLVPDADNPQFFNVLPRSREIIWSGDLRTGAQPFFFDPECTRMHCFAVPPGTIGGIDATTIGGTRTPPSTSSPVFTLTLSEDRAAASLSTTSVSVPPDGAAAVAGDYDDDGRPVEVRMRRAQLPQTFGKDGNMRTDHFFIEVGGASVDLFQQRRYADAQTVDDYAFFYFDNRYVMHADARVGFLAIARERVYTKGVVVEREVWTEIYRYGQMVHEQRQLSQVGSAINGTGLARQFPENPEYASAWSANTVSPFFPLYNFSFWSAGLLASAGYQCVHAGFLVLPYQAGRYYGARRVGGSAGVPVPISTFCSAPPERERPDFEGRDIVFSAASRPELPAMVSGYAFTNGQLDSFTWCSSRDLAELTGVGGANARYHPIWLLGRPITT